MELARHAKVYLDTSTLIYLTESNASFKTQLEFLFIEVERVQAKLITSELAYTEVLTLPFRQNNKALVMAYERLFDTLVEPLPVTREVLLLCARLCADTPSQKTPDAIHVATAILAKADAFVTGDKDIKNLPETMRPFVL